MRRVFSPIIVGLALSACAGRDPQPMATVQMQDAYSDCTMIRAEIEGNNQKAKQLADEQGLKTAQNVAAGVVGIVIWPVWFGLDTKGAASTETAALQSRQQYLTTLRLNGVYPDIDRHPRYRLTARLHKATTHRLLGNDRLRSHLGAILGTMVRDHYNI
jgi:hypothetical protein